MSKTGLQTGRAGVVLRVAFAGMAGTVAMATFARPALADQVAAPNTCTATAIRLADGLASRTVVSAGVAVTDLAGASAGTALGEGDMMVSSTDGRFIYTVTETTSGGQLQRTEVATGATVIVAQSTAQEVDADGKPIVSSSGSALVGWRRLDPIKWLPNGQLIIGEEDSFGRNFMVNPTTGAFVALDATGWFEHEGIVIGNDGYLYQGDERANGGLYRFIPATPGDFTAGKLQYLTTGGTWKDAGDPKKAQATQLADAAAARFQRIEDMELGPDGMVYGTETAFPTDGNPYNVGRVFRFRPGESVTVETFVANGAGMKAGDFQWPDNIVFDNRGNLIIAEDIPDDSATPPTNAATKQYNNQQDDLWLVTPGKQVFRLGNLANSAKATPCQNEWTGMIFSPDYATLYVHQQHADNPLLAISGYQAAMQALTAAPGAPKAGESPVVHESRTGTWAAAVAGLVTAAGLAGAFALRRRLGRRS